MRLHFDAVGQARHPFDHDCLPGGEAGLDAIVPVEQFAQFDRGELRPVLRIENPYLRLAVVSYHRLLRHHQRLGIAGTRHACAHEHARQEQTLRVVHQHAQQDVAGEREPAVQLWLWRVKRCLRR